MRSTSSATASSVRSSVIARTSASLTSSIVWSRAGSTALRSKKMLRLALRPIVGDSSPSSASKMACAMRARSSAAMSGSDVEFRPGGGDRHGLDGEAEARGDLGQRLRARPGVPRPGRGCRCTRCAPAASASRLRMSSRASSSVAAPPASIAETEMARLPPMPGMTTKSPLRRGRRPRREGRVADLALRQGAEVGHRQVGLGDELVEGAAVGLAGLEGGGGRRRRAARPGGWCGAPAGSGCPWCARIRRRSPRR